MNYREQYLKQQNQRLQQQVHFLLDVVDRMAADHELLGSVACGFAWDMESHFDGPNTAGASPAMLWEYRQRLAEEVP